MRLLNTNQENERELLETLEALVNNLGARNVTANALHLHPNTLMYRIKKIENQTGYELVWIPTASWSLRLRSGL